MGIRNIGQQGIVFAVFAALFAIFAIALPGFLTTANMLTLLQNVAVLGILGLAMAIVVIGRGIDISLIAALAVPPGLVLQMVQDGHSLPISLAAAFALTAVFGLVNGWLIAYAEVPSLFTTLASGLFLAGLGQAALVQARRRAMEPGARRLRTPRTGQSARHPDAGRDVRARLHRGRLPAAADPARRLHLRDRRQSRTARASPASRPVPSSCCNMSWRR